jgi:predicted AlkP superfamily pyrophosphatase or phosphodiesterase
MSTGVNLAVRRRGLRRASPALRPWIGALVIPLFLGACGEQAKKNAPSKGKAAGQNLLLITLDTTRADRLGCYGYGEPTSPVLDRLARQGVLFERAITQAPLTQVAHTSMLTGLYPKEHGIHDNGAASLVASQPTLATAPGRL